ncbi:Na(+)/H(+) exchange regulatory cofactor NHE-RF2-like [Corythoichthys intestinalis]|uniref:Na(+)/H(+) exchange regulatory cofactor NHE-RF2-like n=1 Tax=Corythoichthys intestinalis TaxID=161448 RepID=UPI0025A68525|nr:Na(+)/H(+) exchange regulatory cofactor NHE-RF2-like [Corythoichthys intestinalis]XP_057700644.1 Na(+)/H(+) exchange regulatory cofactor NHE-RF2-like [Corythoichthys intestinalis]XP_061792168.1 Na(+)/H(+) exchange regulatory cofactor NHE-RF2-like [Nerophis lumbriciformis]
MECDLRPRVCYLVKTERGYGFHLHGEKSKGGQFIRRVEPGSSADLAGLRPGDRVVEVNGENVENDSHHQVVERIREVPHRTRLLVVDRNTEDYLRSCGLACTEDLAIEMGTLSPRPSPMATPSTSPLPRGISPKSLKPDTTLLSTNSCTLFNSQDKVKRSSMTSSTVTDVELQMEASPEPSAELLPRLCHLVKGEKGYGFNLHGNKAKCGQFVRSVDPHSPAERADIRPGDRLVEVNGVNIERLRHSEVVAFIKEGEREVHLLVVDKETDELFNRLGITPTARHVYMEETAVEVASSAPSPTSTEGPIIHVTLTDAGITSMSPKPRANGSCTSQSSTGSTTQSEISSSDMSFQVPEEDDRRVLDPFMDSGLRLSPTAAEAKQKALGRRNKKRAPPMDWSRKQEIFSNF